MYTYYFAAMSRAPEEASAAPVPSPSPYPESVSSAGLKTTSMDKSAVPDLPKHVTYLLVGAGTASFAAFRAIKAKLERERKKRARFVAKPIV